MTIGTYAAIIPLPPPVTTGTTIQSYTDPNGDVWVAKNGVNVGAWKRAVNALRASVTLTSSFSAANGWNNLALGQIVYDAYGLMTPGQSPFTAPLPGFYDVRGCIGCNLTTQRFMVSIYKNGAEFSRGFDATSGTCAPVTNVLQLNAGDVLALYAFCGAAMTITGGAGNGQTYFTVSYLNPLTG